MIISLDFFLIGRDSGAVAVYLAIPLGLYSLRIANASFSERLPSRLLASQRSSAFLRRRVLSLGRFVANTTSP